MTYPGPVRRGHSTRRRVARPPQVRGAGQAPEPDSAIPDAPAQPVVSDLETGSQALATRTRRGITRPPHTPVDEPEGPVTGRSDPERASAPAEPLLYTAEQAAVLLQVRSSWLRRKAAARAVPCRFLGKHLRFSRTDLETIAESSTATPRLSQ
jgi:excisionase family DNA binding protein